MTLTFKTRILNFFRQVFTIPMFEKILVKSTISKPHTASIVKFIPNNYQYPQGSWRVAVRNGIKYKLDLHDYVDWWLYYGLKEKGRERLYDLVKPGDIIFDIGTNVGETLMNFARLTGRDGFVYGFEPDSVNYARCNENLSLNNFSNLEVNKTGLGAVESTANLSVNTPSNRGGNRISSNATQNSEKISIISLDDFITKKQVSKINLIKIDVEGFELNVLLGGKNALQTHKPLLFIELDDNNLKEQRQSARELISFLRSLGYSISHAETNETVNEDFNFQNCHFDIICR